MRARTVLAAMLATSLFAATTYARTATYTFTTVDVPGASDTSANDINNLGQIVGFFHDPDSGVPHGFLDTGGSFTPIDVPGETGTVPSGINDAGQIVGDFNDFSNGSQHGFLNTKGTFTLIDVPGALFTFPNRINDQGQIVGLAQFELPNNTIRDRGFLYSGGNFSTIDSLSSFIGFGFGGINNTGQIVGYIGNHGLLYTGGSFTTFDFPGAASTAAFDINDLGQVVGVYDNVGPDHGFVYSDGSFTTIDVPGARQTDPSGINDMGQIVGYYGDTSIRHGFLATPVAAVPEPSSFALLGIGLMGLGILRRRERA